MSNKYYIPASRRPADIVDNTIKAYAATSRNALTNKELKSRERISQNELGLANEKLDQDLSIANRQLASSRRGQDIQLRGQDISRETAALQLPEYKKKFAPSQVMKTQAMLLKSLGSDTLKEIKPFITFFDDLVETGITKGEAYQTARQSWDTALKPALMGGLNKAWEKGISKDPKFAESQEGQTIMSMMDGIKQEGPGIIDGFFAETKRSIDTEAAKMQAATKMYADYAKLIDVKRKVEAGDVSEAAQIVAAATGHDIPVGKSGKGNEILIQQIDLMLNAIGQQLGLPPVGATQGGTGSPPPANKKQVPQDQLDKIQWE